MPDHVHMLISIPPKLAVSSVVGATSKARVRSTWRGISCNEKGTTRARASARADSLWTREVGHRGHQALHPKPGGRGPKIGPT